MKILVAGTLSIAMMSVAFAHVVAPDQGVRNEKRVARESTESKSLMQVAGEMVCDENNRSQCKR